MTRWTTILSLTAGLHLATSRTDAQQGSPASISLDSLLNTRISAASKYLQRSAEAPASVTIVTAAEIRRHAYRNLQEVLESVPGFYVSNDRNYTYLGTRGFSRPSDYNNRILLLIDGHTMNERVWGMAPVGSDLPINFDAVERIEVVHGPGSVLYGTSAMFAVINIVTKTGTELDGVRVAARGGSGSAGEATVAAGRSLGSWGSVAVSGIVNRAGGGSLYFPEYDAAETNFGVTRGTDWEHGYGALAAIGSSDLSIRLGVRSRSKGVPTGAFGTLFGDRRTFTRDDDFWASVSSTRSLATRLQLTARGFGSVYRYLGRSSVDMGPAYTDGGGNTDLGGELTFVWDAASRDRLTFGADVRRTFRADYWERDPNGTVIRDNAPFSNGSLYAQNELQLFRGTTLVSGVRAEKHAELAAALTPRLAVVMVPDSRSTLKVLYGEAFRAPSAAEAHLTTSLYTRNPLLVPERIRTFEIQGQRRVAAGALLGASVYDYRIRNLIEQIAFDSAGALRFANTAASHGRGLELQADLSRGPVSTRLWYALQHSRDDSTNLALSNSPARIASAMTTGRASSGLFSTVTVRYESGRRTIARAETRAFRRTDVSIGYAPERARIAWLNATAVSLRVSNLFGAVYFAPGGLEHRQDRIPQDARYVSLRLSRSF